MWQVPAFPLQQLQSQGFVADLFTLLAGGKPGQIPISSLLQLHFREQEHLERYILLAQREAEILLGDSDDAWDAVSVIATQWVEPLQDLYSFDTTFRRLLYARISVVQRARQIVTGAD